MTTELHYLSQLQHQIQAEDASCRFKERSFVIQDYDLEPAYGKRSEGHIYRYDGEIFEEFESVTQLHEFLDAHFKGWENTVSFEKPRSLQLQDLWNYLPHIDKDDHFVSYAYITVPFLVPAVSFMTKKAALEHIEHHPDKYSKRAHPVEIETLGELGQLQSIIRKGQWAH